MSLFRQAARISLPLGASLGLRGRKKAKVVIDKVPATRKDEEIPTINPVELENKFAAIQDNVSVAPKTPPPVVKTTPDLSKTMEMINMGKKAIEGKKDIEEKKIEIATPGPKSKAAPLPNYIGKLDTPTANAFTELAGTYKKYNLGAKGSGNAAMVKGQQVKTEKDEIDCSGASCKVSEKLYKTKYDPLMTNAKKLYGDTKKNEIDVKDSSDGDFIFMDTEGKGIDHVGHIIVDKKGNKYIGESSSSYNGITITKLEDRIKDLQKITGGKMTYKVTKYNL